MKYCLLTLFLAYSASLLAQNYNVTYRDTVMFPGQALANIWGFKKGGKEYALVGAAKGLIIVDVTDPNNCFRVGNQLTDFITSDWREVRTFGNVAYITSEGLTPAGTPNPPGPSKGGLGIVDLSGLPNNPPTTVTKYYGDGDIAGLLNRAHSLHVDSARSMLYIYGATMPSPNNCNGALRFSLANPLSPTYVDKWCSLYVHDGHVHKDTLFAANINAGKMSIIKFETNPFTGIDTLPYVLDDVTTPTAFTHNTWLSVNRQYAFTTDETQNSYLTSYDVSNRSNIVELDRIRTGTSGAIIHNTYVKGNHAISSYYEDGMTIVDVSRPANLVQTGRYDTYATPPFPVSSSHFVGAWGVYPYLPSGNLLVTNMSETKSLSSPDTGVLYILTPTYVNACFLEGNVKDSITNANLSGVSVAIQHTDPLNSTTSGLTGNFATGQPTAGTFNVTYSKSGYTPRTLPATLVNGSVTTKNLHLLPTSFSDLTVTALNAPQSACDLNGAEPISVVIQNFGTTTQSGFSMAYRVNGGAAVVQSVGALSVAPGASANFTFSSPANLSAEGAYQIRVYSVLAADAFHFNDTLTMSVTHGQVPTPDIVASVGTVCPGGTVNLSVAPVAGASYLWSSGGTSHLTSVNPIGTTLYTVSVTAPGEGCSGSDNFTVQVIPNITVSVSPGNAVQTCPNEEVTLDASVSPGPPTIMVTEYLWNNSQHGPSINVTTPGIYNLSVSTANGCMGNASVSVQNYPSNLTLNAVPLPSGTYRSLGPLTALNANVLPGAVVTFISDTSVELQQDFSVETGAEFEARIEECSGGSSATSGGVPEKAAKNKQKRKKGKPVFGRYF